MTQPPFSPVEAIKIKSRGLRGTLSDSLEHQLTGQLFPDDQNLIKFHGIYQQDDRDRRDIREEKKLEWDYSFMIRLRIPGGDITHTQWLGIYDIAKKYSTGIIKITTRQTVQIHGVIKSKLKPTLQDFAALGLDSIAACGDVNRNVMAGAFPALTSAHDDIFAFSTKISEHLLPKTKAFSEIWLDGEKLIGDEPEEDPLYEKKYLPRKFKISIAIPPHNEGDVYAQDIGLIAIINENNIFTGFNILVGGGMGATHGNPSTYPRLATLIGYADKDKILDVVWQIVAVQRDYGNRHDRKLSRLKYTIDKYGIEWFKAEVEKRLSFALESARDFEFTHRMDMYGWSKDHKGNWFYGIFVENGRVIDDETQGRLESMLVSLAEQKLCHFRFTGNQNIILTYISEENRPKIEDILVEHGISASVLSLLRQDSMACVALNTCPLAMAEGQRYLPTLVTKIEALLDNHNLMAQPISIRMTGCPNGCARPYLAEIGLVGKSMGKYNLHLGANATGSRLNSLWKEESDEAEILSTLDTLFAEYAIKRDLNEGFGDFFYRTYLC